MAQTQRTMRGIARIFAGLFVSFACTGILLILLALGLYKLNLSEGAVTAGIVLIYLLSCMLGGARTGHLAGSRKYFWGFLTGICYFGLLVLLSTLCSAGALSGFQRLFTAFLLCAGGGAVGGMLAR